MLDKRATLAELKAKQQQGKKIVFTNGCFDVLHVGHARYLAEARALGDILVVGLNSDSSTKKLKGAGRPIVAEAERAELLQALRFVDYVIIFPEDTPLELIKEVRPNILVKGGDWPIEKIVGADFVLANGGQVKSLSFVDGRSTTDLVDRIRSSAS